MDFQYIAYTSEKKLVKGRLSATDEGSATSLLNYGGYQLVSLKMITPFLNLGSVTGRFSRIKPREIIMFSRQLALLLESGTDIVTSLELLQGQSTNRGLKTIIGQIASDIRGGTSLSTALSKHPRAFPEIYHRTIAAGEQGGNMEVVLRQMADYVERSLNTEKKIKGALSYPIMLGVVALVVVVVMIYFVMPTFIDLYAAFDVELPMATQMLLDVSAWLIQYGLFLLLALLAVVIVGYLYIRTPAGRYQKDKLMLTMPLIGRITVLSELSRCCRTMALLFKVGLPLPEIMSLVIHGSNNKAMVEALTEVQQELIRGQGLSKPMSKNKLFLPLMVQMVGVGEETGNLDNTLTTVAQSYEVEADDRTSAAVGFIQPAMIIMIAIVIGFIAVSLMSAMYSIYGQIEV
ncbi:MAG: type II secretion system F family protein [Deltaproteobacteria bacterium]|nr:type II secretion system F family protein [Deltaproteobacteria bacterium]